MSDNGKEMRGARDATPVDPVELGLVTNVPATGKWRQYRKTRSRLDWLVFGEPNEPPVSRLDPVVNPPSTGERIGVCCSGGGIRSASFNLGALQAFQREKQLERTRFLSAVSGGSYIAAAFAMVAKTRDEEGVRDPPGDDSDRDLIDHALPPFYPGSPEEQYLRNRASYMAPTGSAKLYLLWRVLMGLLVNLLLIAAFVTLVAALLAIYYRNQHPGLIRPPQGGAAAGASHDGWLWIAGLVTAGVGLIMGMFSILIRPREKDKPRRFLELWSLRVFFIGLGIFALDLVVPELIDALRQDPKADSGDAAGSVPKKTVGAGISASVAGILAAIVAQLRSQASDPIDAAKKAKSRLEKLTPRLRMAFIYLAAAVLGPLLVFSIFLTATTFQVETTDDLLYAAIPAAALIVLFLLYRFGDLNSWSLHPFYRNRLTSAFALRRVWREGDPKTGRAEARAEGELVSLSGTHVTPQAPPHKQGTVWPTLIVCAAANVSDPGAAAPGRGVTSFTFTPFEMGGPLVGGIETRFFECKLSPGRQRDFTLAAVVAMSGAAVSPSMGKLTRPSVRFLLAMANVRLGVWIANPRRTESFVRMRQGLRSEAKSSREKMRATIDPASFDDDGKREQALVAAPRRTVAVPRPTPYYLAKELFGVTSINDKFLYVTDGGHYENLGLVELLRRGCTTIYCFDASGGKQLGELGDAIALARSELGVEISFPEDQLAALVENEKTGLAQSPCAMGTLTYTRSKKPVKGTIAYVPTVMTKELPWDAHALKAEDPEFPHHSTFDQLFTDQKFEGYRVLGFCGAMAAMKAAGVVTADDEELPGAPGASDVPPGGTSRQPWWRRFYSCS